MIFYISKNNLVYSFILYYKNSDLVWGYIEGMF